MTDAEKSGDRLGGLAFWEAIADILFSEKAPLYSSARREMAFAVLDWSNSPTDENFAALRRASRRFEEERIK